MKITLLFTTLFFAGLSIAQCTVNLNASTIRVTQDSTISTNLGAGQHYLICSGATLTYAGTQSATVTYYLEENSNVKSQRSHVAVVYMKANADFDASYSESGNWAITTNAWYMASATFTDHIAGSNFNQCPNVIYNYGSVGNCSGTASLADEDLISSLKIHPNPASEKLYLNFGSSSNKKISIINTLGVVVLEKDTQADNCEILLSSLRSGPYFVRVSDANGYQEVRKIIVKH